MKSTIIKTRKFNKGVYTFILNTPEYVGERGCCGIEITPYITVKTPENDFGYEDTFFYNSKENNGHFQWRYHTPWIKRAIIAECKKIADSLPYSVD